jgi:hypothetical protein
MELKIGDFFWDTMFNVAVEITSGHMLQFANIKGYRKATEDEIEKYNMKDYDMIIPESRFEKAYVVRKRKK